MICSRGRSQSRTLRQSLLVGREQEVRTELSRQARTQDRTLNSSASQPLCRSSAVGTHHVPVLDLCGVFNYPRCQRMRRSNLKFNSVLLFKVLMRPFTMFIGQTLLDAYRRRAYHSEEDGLSSCLSSSSMSHDRTGKPVVCRDISHESSYEIQRQNSENEQIRTLLERDKESRFSLTVKQRLENTNSQPITTEEFFKS